MQRHFQSEWPCRLLLYSGNLCCIHTSLHIHMHTHTTLHATAPPPLSSAHMHTRTPHYTLQAYSHTSTFIGTHLAHMHTHPATLREREGVRGGGGRGGGRERGREGGGLTTIKCIEVGVYA